LEGRESAIDYLPRGEGVIVCCRGELALYSHDLSRKKWSLRTPGWSDTLVVDDTTVLNGPDEHGTLLEVSLATGELIQRRTISPGLVVGFTNSTLLLTLSGSPRRYQAIDKATCGVLWTGEGKASAASQGERYVLQTERGQRIAYVDARGGHEYWSCKLEACPETRGRGLSGVGRIRQGRQGPAITGRSVVVVLEDGSLVAFSERTGRIHGMVEAAILGAHVVTDRHVFSLGSNGIVAWDVETLCETHRRPLDEGLRRYLGDEVKTIAGCWASSNAVCGVTLGGTIFCQLLADDAPDPAYWAERLEGGLARRSESPLGCGEYIYFSDRGHNLALHAFRGVLEE
jgi:hypothetical protein